MSYSRNSRVQWIDIAKGLGIIIMIMGHVGFGGKFDRWIHTFHMPLFFIISGFLYGSKEKNFNDFIYRKCRTLIVPYLFFVLTNYFMWVCFVRDSQLLSPIISAISFNTHGMPISGACWFLTALFFTEIIYCSLDKTIKDKFLSNVVILIIGLLFSLVSSIIKIELPLALSQGLVGLGFFVIGRLLSINKFANTFEKFADKGNIKIFIVGLSFLGINLVLSFVNGYVNMKEGWYSNVLLFWVNACIGIFTLFCLSKTIEYSSKYIRQYLINIGKSSIVYLGFNQLIILLLSWMGIPSIGNQGTIEVFNLIGSILITILTLYILKGLSRVLLSSKLGKIFGK